MRLLKNLRIVLLFTFFSGALLSQSNAAFDIKIRVKGLSNDTCLIANYYGEKQYIKDTVITDKDGWARWQGEEDIEGGIYLFVTPNKNYFEFIVAEPSFTLETTFRDMVGDMKVKGSKENDVFYKYLQFTNKRQTRATFLRAAIARLKKAEGKNDSLEIYQKEQKKLDAEVKAYRDKVMTENEGAFVIKVFKLSEPPKMPETPAGLSDDKKREWEYRTYKRIFFDNVDFSDERLLRTPILHNKVKEYLDRLTVQHPDSVVQGVKAVMEKVEKGGNKAIFRYFCSSLSNKYARSKVMCMEKVYVYILEKFYISGKAHWTDSTQMVKIKDRYYRMKYNQCEEPAVNLPFTNYRGGSGRIYDPKTPLTILYFWDYDCGHCKKVTPKMHELYQEYKNKGVEVIAICTRDDMEKWKKYIEEKGLTDWLNYIDKLQETNFRVYYDIYSTPVIYVIDKNKKIIAKRLDIENLRKFLDHQIELLTGE